MRFYLPLVLAFVASASAQYWPKFQNGNVIVHLFEWSWMDIAEECERFLAPYGFGGVQISPPNEHIDGSQWWTRYQPVSYYLYSRGGSRDEFVNMVNRCNAVGVNIYVDVVINHMAAWGYDFPGVPYGSNNFHVPNGWCSTSNGGIDSYNDMYQVRNCDLVGLNDLAGEQEYVRGKVADFLNDMVNIGVAGFRVDAAKHMWPEDLENIVSRLNDVKSELGGGKPYIYQEVIDQGGEPITAAEYTYIGDVTEFKHSNHISRLGRCEEQLSNYASFGEQWAMLHTDAALVFVDNHDNQRSHGGGGNVVTYHEPAAYKRATAFMLAWNYGNKRIMSSYEFDDTDAGPKNYYVSINADSTCGNGWVCEHRWRQIRNMVKFSGVVGNAPVQNWWSDGNNKIAFSRGNSGFFAMTCYDDMNEHLITGLPDGDYCDVISGDPTSNGCSGKTITVSGGWAQISITAGEDSMIAIHVFAMSGSGGGGISDPVTSAPPVVNPGDRCRTLVFIEKQTSHGQNVFLRGGFQDDSPIPITHNEQGTDPSWRTGDDNLDWGGAENGQDSNAQGSPMIWTTNNPNHPQSVSTDGAGYSPLNMWGDHYWMLDVDMDCSGTSNGWFSVKGFMNAWESDRSQGTCSGSAGGASPYSSLNHMAQCCKVNVFHYDGNTCEINDF